MNPTQRGSMMVDDNDKPTPVGNKSYITTTATTLVKTGPGFLYSVIVSGPVATGTISLYDGVTAVNPFAIITVPANPQPFVLKFNVEFTTGLTIVTGTAAQNITISYR